MTELSGKAQPEALLPEATIGVAYIRGVDSDGRSVKTVAPDLNLTDFRRAGDSDWSAAVQRSYDAAMETPYGSGVTVPAPSVSSDQYEISTQIVCDLDTDKQVSFNGAGMASRVKLNSALGSNAGFRVTAPSAVYEGLVSFNNFSIVGFGANSVGVKLENANGFQSTGVRYLVLEDAVQAENTFAAGFDLSRFRDILGHAFHSTTIAHDTVFNRCNFNTVGRTNDEAVIKIDAASDTIVVAYCDIEGGHHFLEMNGGRSPTIVGNYLEYFDGEWFKFAATVHAPFIQGNWLALSVDQNFANMIGGTLIHNTFFDQSPGAMAITYDAATFRKMERRGNRGLGTAVVPSPLEWYYIGSGTETTQFLEDRTLNLQSLTAGGSVVANQYIGGVAFRNAGNVPIAGIGAHYKTSANGSASYLLAAADNVGDALKIEGAMTTAKGGMADAVGQLQAMPRSTTAALTAIGNAINTTNKFAGKAVINTTTGAIVTANGATAGATWLALDGTTAHTPV